MYDPFKEIDFEKNEELEKINNIENKLFEIEEDEKKMFTYQGKH